MVESIKKVNIVQPVVAGNAVKRQVKKAMNQVAKSRKPVMKRSFKIEKWAKAIFHYNDVPGGTLKWSVQGEKYEAKDGEEKEGLLEMFKRMNDECKVVRRQHIKGNGDQIGTWVKTKRYEPRLWWEIIDQWEKKTAIDVIDEEATANQE